MYFEEGRRYFDRNGEYEVIKVLPSGSIRIQHRGELFTTITLYDNLDVKQLIDINVRAERLMQDFIDYCRLHCSIYADISKDQLERFCSRYEQTTGRKLRPVYSVYVRKTVGKHYSLSVVLPASVLNWMPSNFHGSWRSHEKDLITIYNTAFAWTLFQHGMLLGAKHRKPAISTKKDSALPKINFGLAFGGGKKNIAKAFGLTAETSLPVCEGFGRLRNPDGSISPTEDTGFRFRRAA